MGTDKKDGLLLSSSVPIREIRGVTLHFLYGVGLIRRMLHEEITQDIIGAGMTILNALKPALDEKLYENALVIELLAQGHMVEQQRAFPVHYRGKLIGTLVPDLIVDGKVIVDPKAVTTFNESHLAQMLGYLNITGLEVALLLNFKESKLHWKRVMD